MPYTLQDLITEFHEIKKEVTSYRLGQHFINELIKDSSSDEMCRLWYVKDYNTALSLVYEVVNKYEWDITDLPLREK